MAEETRAERNREKQEIWSSHVEAWKSSGLSQIDYCRQHNLSKHRFTYWKRKLYREDLPVKFIALSGASVTSGSGYNNQAPIKLHIGGYQIEIGDGFSPDTLSSLVYTLSRL